MRVGLVNGVFDLFHDGHRFMLREAAMQCDLLIVAVNHDKWVTQHKGEGRPFDYLEARMKHIRNFARQLPCIVSVIPFDGYEEGLIVHIHPDVVFKGYDHGAHHTPDKGHYLSGSAQVAKGIGCDIVHIGHLPGYSTTELAKHER